MQRPPKPTNPTENLLLRGETAQRACLTTLCRADAEKLHMDWAVLSRLYTTRKAQLLERKQLAALRIEGIGHQLAPAAAVDIAKTLHNTKG